jgi:hypothetical protein
VPLKGVKHCERHSRFESFGSEEKSQAAGDSCTAGPRKAALLDRTEPREQRHGDTERRRSIRQRLDAELDRGQMNSPQERRGPSSFLTDRPPGYGNDGNEDE